MLMGRFWGRELSSDTGVSLAYLTMHPVVAFEFSSMYHYHILLPDTIVLLYILTLYCIINNVCYSWAES
jgi:hypothetical protein